jgi:hypothetical protein
MTSVRHRQWVRATAFACALALTPGEGPLLAQQPAAPATPVAKKTADQMDSLVAPIALYPDPLLAQVLAASTYPLEIVQAARWLKENAKLTGENLTKAAAKQSWDASVSAMVAFPDALKLLDTNIQWTQELGNTFLDQQSEVMDAVQRMRKKAKDGGKLESSKEQKVEVKTVEQKTVIVIQPSDPQVIYVPSYNPTVVYGAAPVYAYPPVVYPSTGAVVATAAVSFGVGVMMGAMWGGCCGGSYGWGANWGGNNNITINNNFNNRYGYNNISGGNRVNTGDRNTVGSGNSSWQHKPEHRRSVPYGNKDTAQRFNGSARDQSGRTERFDGRGNQAGDRGNDRGNDRGSGDRAGSRDNAAARDRDTGGNRDRGQSGSRAGQDKVGNRAVDSGGRSDSAFGNSGSRAKTEAASNRGFSRSRSSAGSTRSSGGGGSRSSGGASRGGGGRRR